MRLTEAGQQAAERLSRVRQDGLAKICAGWQPDQNPRLLALITTLTHQLAASSETPDAKLDEAAALSPGQAPHRRGVGHRRGG